MIKVIGIEVSILSLHLVLVQFGLIPGIFAHSLQVNLFLAFLFITGLLIAVPGIKKGAENFSIRFLVMTTIQMLLMMGLILGLAFAKISQVKILGYTSIALFILLLVIQSAFLISKMNRK